jgi:hypothetical protein
MISFSDTVVNPLAVVVEPVNAHITHRTVFGPQILQDPAGKAHTVNINGVGVIIQ